MKDAVYSTDGIPVCYEAHGTGTPALVFVHGWSCDRSYWSRQIGYFAGRYQVVAIDLGGHGESGVGRRAWTMPAFGDDVVAVVEQLGLESTVLVGHSMGGDVIVYAALQVPGQVAGLVWADVYSTLGEPRTREELQQFLVPFREDFVTATRDHVRRMFLPSSDATLADWVVGDMSAAPPEIAIDALEHAIGNDRAILAGLRELKAPVVAINPGYRPTDVEALGRHGVKTVPEIRSPDRAWPADRCLPHRPARLLAPLRDPRDHPHRQRRDSRRPNPRIQGRGCHAQHGHLGNLGATNVGLRTLLSSVDQISRARRLGRGTTARVGVQPQPRRITTSGFACQPMPADAPTPAIEARWTTPLASDVQR